MSKSVLDVAHILLKRRKFSSVITMLESYHEYYEDDFDYYMTLGIACLYIGETGSASSYFQKARRIKLTNTSLLLGQAAIFLRRGDTDRALEYYLEILSIDPGNKRAAKAMEFIRKNGDDYSVICKWTESGKIKKFYPPIGVNTVAVGGISFVAAILIACFAGFYLYIPKEEVNYVGPRANLESLVLTEYEQKNPQSDDLSGTVIHYILDSKAINKSYQNALLYFQNGRDNAAQVEINRLLGSNASLGIKKKAQILQTYIDIPTFDTLKDNYDYETVSKDPMLYLNVWVAWSGRISNARALENGKWTCELLVGYEDMKKVDGIVAVDFDYIPTPEIDGDRPVRFLAKVDELDGRIVLRGRSVYQPLKGNSLP